MPYESAPIGFDYDKDPERFRANVDAVAQYGLMGDVHEEVAARLAEEDLRDVLDMGCGEGRFVKPARAGGLRVVALDYSSTMLAAISAPRVQANATSLPFAGEMFDAVVALYVLYHLMHPVQAVADACRVLRPGGLFAACLASRHNDPELAAFLPSSQESFDAENGQAIIGEFFDQFEVERWDAPLVHLPDEDALRLYLRGRQLDDEVIELASSTVELPLTLTKRGALFYAYKGR